MIQRLLTQPRQPPPGVIQSGQAPIGPNTNPSGVFNASGPGLSGGGGGQFGAGGIAGVASKHEGKGIKLVNDRERIEEWEFIYDPAKDRGGRPGQNAQTQQPGMPGMPGMGMGNANPAQGTGFGGQQQGSFGSSFGGGFGGSQPQQGTGGFGQQQGGGFNQQPPGRRRN
ncbi:MAG: hypothetical protein FJW36_00575 [Acidobacteria bacterium]|nr:hypothetical protein [Acidobacteriota bacterium]